MTEGANAKRILLTGCGGPLGVNVTRSLQQAEEALHLVGTECNRFHVHLSLTDEAELIPPAREGEAYLAALQRIIAEKAIEMILPTHPVEVRTIAAARERFAGVRSMLPETAAIFTAQDKWQTYQLLRDAGLAVPATELVDSPETLRGFFAGRQQRPIWVRGAGVPGAGIGVASLPCREADHAVAWVDHHRGWGKFIASEYLPGRNLTWTGLFYRGALVACQSRERLEYVIPHVSPSGITGAPAVSRTVSRPDLRQSGEAAIRALTGEPHGVFFVDSKEDAAGVPRITEINAGRFGTTIHFYTAAGCNLPHMLVKLAYGEPLPDAPAGQLCGPPRVDPIAAGTYWIRTLDCGPALVTDIDE